MDTFLTKYSWAYLKAAFTSDGVNDHNFFTLNNNQIMQILKDFPHAIDFVASYNFEKELITETSSIVLDDVEMMDVVSQNESANNEHENLDIVANVEVIDVSSQNKSVNNENENLDAVVEMNSNTTSSAKDFSYKNNQLFRFLNNSLQGRIILEKYKLTQTLDYIRLKDLILFNKMEESPVYKLKGKDFEEITDQIIELFPTEDRDLLYVPAYRQDNNIISARGGLYNHYKYIRRQLRKVNLLAAKKDINDSFVSADPPVEEVKSKFDCLSDKHQEKYSSVDIIRQWENTFLDRIEALKLKSKDNKYLSKYFNSFPCVRAPIGIALLESDFITISEELLKKKIITEAQISSYPTSFSKSWPGIAPKVIELCKKSRLKEVKDFLRLHEHLLRKDSCYNVLALLLLPLCVTVPKNIKIEKTDPISIPKSEISKAFILHVKCGGSASEGVVSVSGVVGGGGGMDCMPLRPGPFHYLISEQAKSLVALQELQNEVGALLEFRDLVIETFPNLRHKMAVTAASSSDTNASSAGNGTASVLMSSSQGSHIPLPLSSQSPSSRRIGEWEPGKVRRRVAQSRENESSSSSLPRSRSNSHSGGNKHSATVQDSGFSTETSSKDSASTAIPRPQSPSSRPVLDEAEDELWNLLDVIHRKGVRLREEVESLQGRLESVAPGELDVPSDILDAVHKVTRHRRRRRQHQPQQQQDHHHLDDDVEAELELRERHHRLLLGDDDDDVHDDEDDDSAATSSSRLALLQREKLQLLDRVAELEAETISSRLRAQELQAELAALSQLRSDLEDRLRARFEAGELGLLAPGAQRIQPIEPSAPTSALLQSPRGSNAALNIRSKDSAFASVVSGGVSDKAHKSRFRTRTIEKNVLANVAIGRSTGDTVGAANDARAAAGDDDEDDDDVDVPERYERLGTLDAVLISPARLMAQVPRNEVDPEKIAAILSEQSPVELQRHLITSTVHNQVLQKRLDEVEKDTKTLTERLGKVHEENEDLRFQLAERNIELEGTRARVRVLERLQQRPATENDADDESEPHQPMGQLNGHHLPRGLDTLGNCGGSSTESSREAQPSSRDAAGSQLKPSPRRRPSRIPLPGAGKPAAPRPPNSASSSSSSSSSQQPQQRRGDGGRESLKSLGGGAQRPGAAGSSVGGRPGKPGVGRDSSRESLGRSSLPRAGQSRSLPRNNSTGSRDSIGRQHQQPSGSLSRAARDSLEQQQQAASTPGTPPRRPPAPARRGPLGASAGASARAAAGAAAGPDNGGKMSTQSSNPPSSWFSSGGSLYPDSLNSDGRNVAEDEKEEEDRDEESSRTGSTRVEFIIGSPTRRRLFRVPWTGSPGPPRYFDSIDTEGMMWTTESDGYPSGRGEALAERDSLECQPR